MTKPPPILTAGTTPALVAEESTPALKTLYLGIDLKNGASATTAVFIPNALAAQSPVDVLLYLHGHKGYAERRVIKRYVDSAVSRW